MSTVTANLKERVALPGLGLKRAWVTCAICLLASVALISPTISRWLQFDHWAIRYEGEDWRILTGHVVHWNANHFLWDVAMFGFLGVLCERRDRVRFLICLFVSAVAISVDVYWLLPEMMYYRGLSGIDSALFTLASVLLLRDAYHEQDRFMMGLFCIGLAGLVGKLAFEIVTGTTLFVDSAAAGFTPLPLVHVVGAVVGCATGCWDSSWKNLAAPKAPKS